MYNGDNESKRVGYYYSRARYPNGSLEVHSITPMTVVNDEGNLAIHYQVECEGRWDKNSPQYHEVEAMVDISIDEILLKGEDY